MKIEVIENKTTGYKSLFINTLEAIKACGINGKVELKNDIQTILKYGIRATPALVVNGVVLIAGQLQSSEHIMNLLQQQIPHIS